MAWFDVYRYRKGHYVQVMSVLAAGFNDALSYAVQVRGHRGFELVRR